MSEERKTYAPGQYGLGRALSEMAKDEPGVGLRSEVDAVLNSMRQLQLMRLLAEVADRLLQTTRKGTIAWESRELGDCLTNHPRHYLFGDGTIRAIFSEMADEDMREYVVTACNTLPLWIAGSQEWKRRAETAECEITGYIQDVAFLGQRITGLIEQARDLEISLKDAQLKGRVPREKAGGEKQCQTTAERLKTHVS